MPNGLDPSRAPASWANNAGWLRVRGARQHNLKNINLDLPRDRLIVITGLSGSGKSSLAFDTIYAEGQRRYVESLSAYARQFLGQMDKPDVDAIEGLSPAISIDQKSSARNPRSTVGTTTEIYDHLRLLFARIGQSHCPQCDRPIASQSVSQIVDQVLALPDGARVMILAPLVSDRKTEGERVVESIRRAGFRRARIDGELVDLDDGTVVGRLERHRRHTIEAVVDRLTIRHHAAVGEMLDIDHGDEDSVRLADSVETALRLSEGIVVVAPLTGSWPEQRYSEKYNCPFDGTTLEELEPRSFSFNSPHGACAECTGLGIRYEIDLARLLPNPDASITKGPAGGSAEPWYWRGLLREMRSWGLPIRTPLRQLSDEARQNMLYGSGEGWEGLLPALERRFRETDSNWLKGELERYMVERPCPACAGARLKPSSLAVRIGECNIAQLCALDIDQLNDWLAGLFVRLDERQMLIARQLIKEIEARLRFLLDVGLDYLTLARSSRSLSGGEAQRIRLATQIGSGLMGVLYILDEPSIGLHQRDNARLLSTLTRLRDLGNTLLVVEHDEETIRAADWVVDIGPAAGEQGGEVVAAGPLDAVLAEPRSLTGAYLRGEQVIMPDRTRRQGQESIVIRGAQANNLRRIDVAIPLSCLVAVTGVSGSGKSTLVNDILYRSLAKHLHNAREEPGEHTTIEGIEHIDKVIEIDQSPIGRTPRSNPATYVGLFTPIRELFAATPEARARGYRPGRFSFNVKGGRCENCRGDGIIKIEMQFLPDVYVPCEVCAGKRYNREALEIRYRGHSIADVLAMTVDEALPVFAAIPAVRNRLCTLNEVGLGYIRLGQPATTLSGGEAQRIKLATELARRATGRTFYLLDEPTTGLHFADVHKLLDVLHRLVESGNSVLVIEHNLDVIKTADWIIDLGPEGGRRGGHVVATGTPEQIARHRSSATGAYLASLLAVERSRKRRAEPIAETAVVR